MNIDALLEQFLQTISKEYGREIDPARREYFLRCGEPFQDEPSYELRLRNFLEWYLLDRPLALGLTPYEAYMADAAQAAAEKAQLLPFRDQLHSLFLVDDVVVGGLALVDLWTDEKYRVTMDVTAGYDPNAVVEMRLVEIDGKTYATNTHVYHAPESAKTVRKLTKELRKERRVDLWEPFIGRANAIQLKTERYRHVASEKIYRDLVAEVTKLKQPTEQAA